MHSHLHGHPALLHAVRKLEGLSVDQFELYFLRKSSTKIDCKNQEVDSLMRSEDVGLAIRILRDHRMGFSYTTSLESAALDRAISHAVEVAPLMPAQEFMKFCSFSESVYPAVDTYDSKGLQAPIVQKIDFAKRLEAACKAADKRVTAVRAASFTETAYEIHLVDSHGENLEHRATLFSASITCKAEDQGDQQMGGDFSFSRDLDRLDVTETAQRAATFATELLGAGSAPTMKCPAVIRNCVVAELLEFLSSSFSAEEIDKGRSILAGRMGDRLFSEQVTLFDDGLLPGGYSTQPFDGEGTPSARTTLVDGGFLQGALYDNHYALKLGKESTSSCQRSIKSKPTIGITNLYLSAGRKTFEQLHNGISRGILITDLMGVHTANPITGDFSLGASGILIENGKLTRPVRGFAVAGNILELFRKITDVGSDQRFFGNIGAASVRVSELSVGGT